ncbi:hypothetical protein AL036_20360 [Salipiger aestuarii]|uniref:hypothetical protein n=1 Tax=Salipiger aestuarii TaxID=568098 RepID=UPI00025B65A1|nr:hypothetical protein [Salipiger aestuarii]EIE49078.1 hypothetical protein C357_20657 [Citreicella sp. 357]KAA8605161.1 hypothetical protein AL036_20360 [Salipiger aestuarii]KAA8607120.1 hypothetical protein AL037_19400 [Salipiger aestuarii]
MTIRRFPRRAVNVPTPGVLKVGGSEHRAVASQQVARKQQVDRKAHFSLFTTGIDTRMTHGPALRHPATLALAPIPA